MLSYLCISYYPNFSDIVAEVRVDQPILFQRVTYACKCLQHGNL